MNEFVKQFATMCAGEKITGSGTHKSITIKQSVKLALVKFWSIM